MLGKFLKNDFVKSVSVLMTGTILAQTFSLVISPILTRIYTPDEMGDLNLYARIVGFLAALATARFELSLPLPKKDEHSYLLYRLSLKIALFMLLGISVFAIVYLFFAHFDSNLIFFIALIISSTLFLIFTNLGINWAIRKKQFRMISLSKMINSIATNVLKWLFGVLSLGSKGLLLASLIGFIAGSVSFVREWFKLDNLYYPFKSAKKTRIMISAYREFPTINLPHVLVDLGKDLLLAFFMIFFFSKDVFAWYSHSYAMLQLPISIIGISIGQVFFSRCSELINTGKSTVPLLRKTVFILLYIAIIPFTILFFFGSSLFAFVFGENWVNSGYYSEIMAYWFLVYFINAVVSSLPTVLHRQQQFFYLGIVSAVIQLIGFGLLPLIIGTNETDFPKILTFVATVQGLFFVFTIYMMFYFAKKGVKSK